MEKKWKKLSDRLKIQNTTETIEMEDTPTVAIKHKKRFLYGSWDLII